MTLKNVRHWPWEVKSGSVIVKIYRVQNKGRRSFMVSYFSGGKRMQKMFADFEDAHAEARRVCQDVSRGEVNWLNLPNKDRMTFYHALKAVEPTGVALDLAAKEYAAAYALLGGGGWLVEAAREYARRNLHRVPNKPVAEAVAELLAAKEKEGVCPAYLKMLRIYLGKFSAAFRCSLLAVRTGDVADFLRDMDGAARSKNNLRKTLGGLFSFAKERGWLPRDHPGMEMVPKFKERAGAIEIFTAWELVHYLNQARAELVPFLTIGAFAGLRHAEIKRLDWREVRLGDRFIEVTANKAKTASRRLVPMSENLVKWLTPHAQKAGPVVPFEQVTHQIDVVVRAANEALRAEAAARGREPEKAPKLRWKKNALRHSFISYRLAEVQSAAQVALEAGNSPRMIFEHYRELVRPKDAQSWFSITPGEDGKIVVLADGHQAEGHDADGKGIAGAFESKLPVVDQSA